MRLHLSAAVASAFLFSTPAQAVVVFDSGADSENNIGRATSDLSFSFARVVGGVTTLGAASLVNGATFFGAYNGEGTPPASEDFVISFHGFDGPGDPIEAPLAAPVAATLVGVDTGEIFSTSSIIYRYDIAFPEILLPAGDTLFSVYFAGEDPDDVWGWLFDAAESPRLYTRRLELEDPWEVFTSSYALAYDLTYTAPAPVPAAAPLLAAGLGGLVWLRRRRRG